MRVIVLTLMVAAAASACRYYCKTPDDEAYCCDGGKEYRNPEVHDGDCPEVRPVCPRFGKNPPDVCPHDGACPHHSKCCYDVCLGHHTCKLAVFPSYTVIPTITPPTAKPPFNIAIYARNKANRGGKA
ncbi:uncharacterized protein LOC119594632 [Penaeus monodon]|uniref:uncharacterized protein LOC119594632 n=1 Tax=Penaeus monodon TaxID=6687 RepID=UPI0018A6EBC5|nr:uncharacterized protein LOC119594632 [Penaeus monodon]